MKPEQIAKESESSHQVALFFIKNRTIKKCKVCFNFISKRKSHAEKQGMYCSRVCMGIGYKINLKGSNNPNYKNGISSHPDYYGARQRKFYKLNPDIKRNINRSTRAKRRNVEGKHSYKDIAWKLIVQKYKCYWCYEDISQKYHIDHVIPVSRKGTNCRDNVVPTCSNCNLQKRAMLPEEWFSKPDCRAVRRIYEAGKYCEGFGIVASASIVCLGS